MAFGVVEIHDSSQCSFMLTSGSDSIQQSSRAILIQISYKGHYHIVPWVLWFASTYANGDWNKFGIIASNHRSNAVAHCGGLRYIIRDKETKILHTHTFPHLWTTGRAIVWSSHVSWKQASPQSWLKTDENECKWRKSGSSLGDISLNERIGSSNSFKTLRLKARLGKRKRQPTEDEKAS